jgi:hypothetical protein
MVNVASRARARRKRSCVMASLLTGRSRVWARLAACPHTSPSVIRIGFALSMTPSAVCLTSSVNQSEVD